MSRLWARSKPQREIDRQAYLALSKISGFDDMDRHDDETIISINTHYVRESLAATKREIIKVLNRQDLQLCLPNLRF